MTMRENAREITRSFVKAMMYEGHVGKGPALQCQSNDDLKYALLESENLCDTDAMCEFFA